MINYCLLGEVVFFVGIIIGIGYILRYINDKWFNGKEWRKYYKEREKRGF